MNILLVDDEQLALQDLEEVVKKALPNAEIYSFLKARDAIDFAKSKFIDIAFLDIDMQVLNGIEMAEKLVRLWPKINIIFCTGYGEYSGDAFKLHASGYLMKPITVEQINEELLHLRNKLEIDEPRLKIHCFGNFEAFCDNKPIKFRHRKTKELLAYLVDRNGASCTPREIMAVMFEKDNQNYYSLLRQELIKTFETLGLEGVIQTSYGMLSIDKTKVKCDYFDYLDEKFGMKPKQYMQQYSLGEMTAGLIIK